MKEILSALEEIRDGINGDCAVSASLNDGELIISVDWPGGLHFCCGYNTEHVMETDSLISQFIDTTNQELIQAFSPCHEQRLDS